MNHPARFASLSLRSLAIGLQLALVLVLSLCGGAPALAFDPDDMIPPDEPPPAEPAVPSAPAPEQIPDGLYRVTEVYTGDVISRSGDVTTYATLTERRETDTFARVLGSVTTGQRSEFDGLAFNGRQSLSNGAAVGGTFYQNFVLSDGAFIPVSVVFFQDDRELARHTAPPPPPTPPLFTSPLAPVPQQPSVAPAAAVAPSMSAPAATQISPQGDPPPAPVFVPAAPPLPAVGVGADPSGGAQVLTSLEVVRGRRYGLRVNAVGAPTPVTLLAWSLESGTNDAGNPPGWRAPEEALAGLWTRLPAPGEPWTLRLRVRVRAIDGRSFESGGRVQIWVRAPAVVE